MDNDITERQPGEFDVPPPEAGDMLADALDLHREVQSQHTAREQIEAEYAAFRRESDARLLAVCAEVERLKPLAALGETNSGRIDAALCQRIEDFRRVAGELAAALEEACERMTRARMILTDNNPRPSCNWGMLDAGNLQAALASFAALTETKPC